MYKARKTVWEVQKVFQSLQNTFIEVFNIVHHLLIFAILLQPQLAGGYPVRPIAYSYISTHGSATASSINFSTGARPFHISVPDCRKTNLFPPKRKVFFLLRESYIISVESPARKVVEGCRRFDYRFFGTKIDHFSI